MHLLTQSNQVEHFYVVFKELQSMRLWVLQNKALKQLSLQKVKKMFNKKSVS